MANKKITERVTEKLVEVETLAIEILSPVLHDGERLVEGAVHEIEAAAAKALIACGAAKAAAPAPAADAAASAA